MARLMSVALTEEAVVRRQKSVTRRLGWWEDKNGRRLLKPGDGLTLCRKVMGRKAGEPLVRLAEVEVVDVRRELLGEIYQCPDDVSREGFLNWSALDFLMFFCHQMKVSPWDEVTRIEWCYLDGGVS